MAQVMGFRDGKGRARFKLTGRPDSESFATVEEAERASRTLSVGRSKASPKVADTPASRDAKVNSQLGIRFTQAEVDRAASKARAEERGRISAVFASEHSRGRERLCATLLAASDGWAASDIVNRLPRLSTDAEFERKLAEPERARSDAAWDRANAKLRGGTAELDAAPTATQSRSDAMWDKARGEARVAGGSVSC